MNPGTFVIILRKSALKLLPADPRPEAGIEIGGADSPKEILESKMQNAHVVGRSSGRPLGSRRTAVRRLSDGRRTVVGRSSDGRPTAVGSSSDRCPTAVRRPSNGRPKNIRRKNNSAEKFSPKKNPPETSVDLRSGLPWKKKEFFFRQVFYKFYNLFFI